MHQRLQMAAETHATPRESSARPTLNRSVRLDAEADSWRDAMANSVRMLQSDDFDRLVAEHSERVHRLARRLLASPDGADDAVQDVFLAALEGRRRFRGECSESTWLTAITVRVCRRMRRKRWLAWRRLAYWFSRSDRAAPEAHRDGASAIVRDEAAARVRDALVALAQPDREVLVLRYLEELPIDAIAQILRLSRNGADVRLTRAREKLRMLLGSEVDHD